MERMSMVPATREQNPPPSPGPIQWVWKEPHRRMASLRFGGMCAATLLDHEPLDPSLCSYAGLVNAESQMLQRYWSVKQPFCISYNSMGHNSQGWGDDSVHKELAEGTRGPKSGPKDFQT